MKKRILYLRNQPAKTEGDFQGMFVISVLIEVLQRVHAHVPRARRRIAVAQNRLQQVLAFRIVSAQREREREREMFLI